MSTLVDDRVGELERDNAELRRLLAERTAERDEALARETATAEVLRVINSSPGDLAPVFDAMLDKAMELCATSFGILRTYDGARFQHGAARGVPPAFAEFLARHPPQAEPGTLGARILSGEPLI
ncbi:MAG: histidine kinase, partial [Alphaproteobacteria bacterium]